MTDDTARTGWELVENDEAAAGVIGGLLELDPGGEYTRGDIAEASGVALKTLYLVETLGELERAGMVRCIEGDEESETYFVIEEESPAYRAASEFDDAVGAAYEES